MRVLGALLAGGQSKRYGSDKALAIYRGQYLIDHALELLRPQCDAIVICGRSYKDYESIQDIPQDNGPLGGLNAALLYAKERHYDAVISFPCDTIKGDTIKGDTIKRTAVDCGAAMAQPFDDKFWFEGEETAYFIDQPVIGYWPCGLSAMLEHWLRTQKRRSMLAWIDYIDEKYGGIKAIDMGCTARFININRPDDLLP